MDATQTSEVSPEAVSHFWSHGYVSFPGVFSREEALQIRAEGLAHRDHPGDLLSHPSLAWFLSDPRVLSKVEAILGARPVYYGDSSCSIDGRSRGFHKDNADRHDPKAPDWRGPYPVLRVGLYLQDYRRASGGIKFRKGSHDVCSDRVGRVVYMGTQPGDLVIWNQRTSHSGNGKILRFPLGLHLDPRWVDRLPASLFAPYPKEERVVLFATFARAGSHLDRAIELLATRKYMVESWKNSPYPPSRVQEAEAKGLSVREVWKEIQGRDDIGQNEHYVPLPYSNEAPRA